MNLNVASVDAHKLSAVVAQGDARRGLEQLTDALAGWSAPSGHTARATELAREWDATVQRSHDLGHAPLPAQSEVIGVVNRLSRPQDVVVCAAGSMPGDLHKLWRTRDRKGYHVEYGFSCMGYEIAGGLGVKMAALDAGEDRDVVVMVGDGSYLMMSQEIVTSVQEGVKLIVVLVQNHGFASIGALSESLGSQRFGTRYRYRTERGLDGDVLPVDLAANAASLGAHVIRVSGVTELEKAYAEAQAADVTTVIHVETDPTVPAPDSPAWWDVPVAETSALESTQVGAHDVRAEQAAATEPPAPVRPAHRGEPVMRTIEHWIAGKSTSGSGERRSPVWNPATGEQQAEVALADASDVDAAVGAAREAFVEWSQSSLSTRTKVLFAFRELVNANVNRLAEAITDEHGKVLSDAAGEVQRGLEVVEFACGIPQLLKGDFSAQVSRGVDLFSFREPVGVCAGITPFNFPAMVPMWMFPVAIACGNTFVLKPSERDPSASLILAELWAEAGTARGRLQRPARRQGRRSTGCSSTRTWTRSRSSGPPRSRATSTRPRVATASACRPSAARRTTRSSSPTPTSTTPPTSWSRPRSGRPGSGAWRSRPPSPWAGSVTRCSSRSTPRPAPSRSARDATPAARWARS